MPRPVRHSRAHRLAWLALVAMLLVFVGPLISQSQRLLVHEQPDMPMAQAQATSVTEPHEPADHGGMRHHADALAACGYCVLFAHTPGLVPTLAPLATTPPPARARPVASLPLAHSEASYPAFAPRAPPRSLMS